MKVVNVQEARTHLSRLLERVAAGEVILLGKHGKPMAKLTASAQEHRAGRAGLPRRILPHR